MEKTHLFASIAEFYDYSMRNNCDYEGWANYLINLISKKVLNGSEGLDLGCGSGYFTRALKRAGYLVTGIDISSEMLTSAQNITAKENLFIPYMIGDITSLKFFKKVDFITAINDAFNCIPDEKLEKSFKIIASLLKPGGIFHFDVSSEYKLREIIANNTFCEDDDDYSYIWFNSLHSDRVIMDMSVFLRQGDRYIKRESTLTEFIHKKERLLYLLEKTGFSILQIDGDMGEFNECSHRINITAKKD